MNGGENPVDGRDTIMISEIDDGDLSEVFQALTQAFGRTFDDEWFAWKHRSGPWGPSPGWVARDRDRLLGVRLLLPWRFEGGGRTYDAFRPCDTVTVPEARGRGVFRQLTEHAMSQLTDRADFLFNTPNSQSKPGYLKMGFQDWGTVDQRLGLVRPKRAALDDIRASPIRQSQRVATVRSKRFFDWRYTTCPVHDYFSFSLVEADGTNGIICRIRPWRGRQMVVVDECWGTGGEKEALIRAACHQLQESLVWISGDARGAVPMSLARRTTSVTRLDLGDAPEGVPTLSVGDVEDVL